MPDEANSKWAQWRVRPYGEGDIQLILEILRVREEAYCLGAMLDAGELARRLHDLDAGPSKSAVVVEPALARGGLLGAGCFVKEPGTTEQHRGYIITLWTRPGRDELEVERAVLQRLLGLIKENESRPGITPLSDVRVYADYREGMPDRKAIFEDMGLTFTRSFFRMARSLAEPVGTPATIEGVTVRNYKRPEDNRGACAAYNASFADSWVHFDQPQEAWDSDIDAASFRPDLSWLAEVDSEPSTCGGFCLCVIHEEANKASGRKEGWIELLGTTREWRGKGLGRSLLLHGLQSLKDAGMETALLGVDSESPTGANLLYERVGFRALYRGFIYSMTLGEAEV